MIKMNYKRAGTIFNLVSYIPIAMPMYTGKVGTEESFNAVIRGFNFAEFSPWGSLLVTMPKILLAITYSKIKNKYKSLILIPFYMLNTVMVYNSTMAADKWIRDAAEGYVRFRPYIVLYLLAVFSALVCQYIHCRKYPDYEE